MGVVQTIIKIKQIVKLSEVIKIRENKIIKLMRKTGKIK